MSAFVSKDETGVYKNLLQETAHRAGMKLPSYTTVRTGPGYAPVFTCTVELAGMSFSGEQARTKKQAQKTAAMVAWFALKQCTFEMFLFFLSWIHNFFIYNLFVLILFFNQMFLQCQMPINHHQILAEKKNKNR